MSIDERKNEHITIAVREDVEFKEKTSCFNDLEFIHVALPEIDFSEVSIETEFLEYRLAAPLVIASMTGGTALAKKLNAILAQVAEEFNIALGVGSQRIALENPSTRNSFSVVRRYAESIPVIGNIGASQLVDILKRDQISNLIDMVKADALALHLNPLQEVLQPEGQPNYSGILEMIEKLVDICPVPVIIKETGAGISKEVARSIADVGIWGIDVGGAGGTSFSKVEKIRSKLRGRCVEEAAAETFAEWGIPTAISILEVKASTFNTVKIIATGGIRSGLDMAKAIRLGANYCGVARPFISEAFFRGRRGLRSIVQRYIRELKISLFLVGARNLEELLEKPIVVGGRLKEWMLQRRLKI